MSRTKAPDLLSSAPLSCGTVASFLAPRRNVAPPERLPIIRAMFPAHC